MNIITRIVALACALQLSLVSYAAPVIKGEKLSEDQTLTRMLRGDPESLDPHLATGMPESHVIRDMFEGLVTQDIKGNIISGQAESWSVSPDGKTWTFKLRPELRWSDGVALTAEDFVYSFRRLADPKTASSYGWYLQAMGVQNAPDIIHGKKPADTLGISAPTRDTLVVELTAPTPFLLNMLTHRSMNPVPAHVIDLHDRDWVTDENIVVNGPFVLDKRVINERIVMVRNPRYWDNKSVVLEQVTFLPIPVETAALARYKASDIDLLERVPPSHVQSIKKDMPEQLKTTPSLSTYYITFNTRLKPFDDVRVRKALSYAIQRERIANDLLGQGQVPAYTFTPAVVTGFKAPEPGYKKLDQKDRLAQARQLMQEAGYSDSQPLGLTYMYNGTEENRRVAVVIQEMWQSALPVQITLQAIEWSTYLENKREGRYQVARALWGGDYDDAMTMLDMHTPAHSNNSSFYDNPEYIEMLRQARLTQDIQGRNKIYANAELQLMDDMPIAPVFWNSNSYLIKPDLRGVSYGIPEGRIYSRNVYKVAP
ncbi:peptide ABC transporter substrate-binding protein [Sansalvadorimonas sp. 2012CJ34-2]|uniref:Peptide ABC transporter substrate-binding protein n=1 Tax=Parendozoicomonas callyspongiae TaxID=2942213 RepID=A0ABT0PJV4_9GAMM|nr:peptide ABC transporter substrate-binding protein [Sansalvadorimonas sp. 2012CJ34-2]MCL6271551.1 peptide ABC transporter substrate-binding protein [Sansalvadorimonas sp. 2012CJ34-2]